MAVESVVDVMWIKFRGKPPNFQKLRVRVTCSPPHYSSNELYTSPVLHLCSSAPSQACYRAASSPSRPEWHPSPRWRMSCVTRYYSTRPPRELSSAHCHIATLYQIHTLTNPNVQLTHAFTPSTLLIRNDSHLHAHHAAMEGSTSKETHFQYAVSPDTLTLQFHRLRSPV
jgi:hypothetical protein